jgi:hypothetical protein
LTNHLLKNVKVYSNGRDKSAKNSIKFNVALDSIWSQIDIAKQDWNTTAGVKLKRRS